MSTPIVGSFAFATDSAVGSPILPMPTTQTRICPNSTNFLINARSCSIIFLVCGSVDCEVISVVNPEQLI